MKHLYVYPYCGLGGVETSILNKIKVMKKLGIESEVLFSKFYGLGAEYFENYSYITVGMEDVGALLEKKFDFITIIDYPDFFSIIDRFKVAGKIIFETHVSSLSEIDNFYSQLNHHRISAIIVPSYFNKRLVEKFSQEDKKIFVLPNPIDTSLFRKISTKELRKSYQRFIRKKILLWIGRLEKEKNPMEFLKIGKNLLHKRKNIHFFIIGDEHYHKDLKHSMQKFIKVNDMTENFTFFKSISYEKMPQFYSLASSSGGCLVSTSCNESLPMIFLEAMACKCPVVSTDVGGVRDLIEDNVIGKLYSLGKIKDGVMTIEELIDEKNQSKRKEIVENAFDKVNKRHSLNSVIDEYERILDNILLEENGREG
ncbi:MAG: glycosyltransferase family 4 protein [Halanaerobiales bacterium]|nr:glycosyltransferase family 4 protein [Halanaerobiales bacterium]